MAFQLNLPSAGLLGITGAQDFFYTQANNGETLRQNSVYALGGDANYTLAFPDGSADQPISDGARIVLKNINPVGDDTVVTIGPANIDGVPNSTVSITAGQTTELHWVASVVTGGIITGTWLDTDISQEAQNSISEAGADARYLGRVRNLSDLDNNASARGNLGLGDSAVRNVGTSSNEVAQGNHTHLHSDITDFQDSVAANSAVAENTGKVTFPGFGTSGTTASPGNHTHVASEITDFQSAVTTNSAVSVNSGKTGITVDQADAIVENTAKTGITPGQAQAIVDNTNKTGISSTQASAIMANTAKVTYDAQSEVAANTAKVTFPGFGVGAGVALEGTTTTISTDQANAIIANTAKITYDAQGAVAANTAKIGITPEQATAITNNTAKVTYDAQSAVAANTAKVTFPGFGTSGTTAAVGNHTHTASDITDFNTAVDARITTIGDVVEFDDDADFTSRQAGISWQHGDTAIFPNGRDGSSDAVTYLFTGIDEPPDRNVTIDTDFTQLTTGSSLSGLGITVTAGSINTVVGRNLQVGSGASDALAGNTTTITSDQATAITANSAKTGITSQQATDITNNNAKVGITSTQASDIATNNAKVGITSAQASAITTNTGKTSFPGFGSTSTTALRGDTTTISSAQATAITNNSAKTGITSQQAADINTNNAKEGITTQQATDISTNNAKVGITPQQISDISTNNDKVGITSEQATAISDNSAKTGITSVQAQAITANTGARHAAVTLGNTNYLSLDGQEVTGNTIPVTAGGTDATTAAGARANLTVSEIGRASLVDRTNSDVLSEFQIELIGSTGSPSGAGWITFQLEV